MAWSPVAIQSILSSLYPPQPRRSLSEALTLTDNTPATPILTAGSGRTSARQSNSAHRIAEAALHQRFIETVHAISSIPLGPAETLAGLTFFGSATPQVKHLLLADCLSLLGLRYRHVIFTFTWRQQHLLLPEPLRESLASLCWEEPHHAIEVETVLGNRIIVDVSWPSSADRVGLPVLPSEWDGLHSFYGVRRGVAVWTGNEGSLSVTNQLRDEIPDRARRASTELWAWLYQELSDPSQSESGEAGLCADEPWNNVANLS